MPQATAPASDLSPDEIDALRDEYNLLQTQGHLRRKSWIAERFKKGMEEVGLGLSPSVEDRLRREGYNRAMKELLDRDSEVEEAWHEYLAAAQQQTEELEGGEHGVSYEAAG